VLIESIYYVDLRRLPDALVRLRALLRPSGFILARIHDFDLHHAYVEKIRELYPETDVVGGTLLRLGG
jgi:hypothetical protein